MKLKEEKVEKEGMNKELYDLFINLVQLEYNKLTFIKGAKFYCWAHGYESYKKFFEKMYDMCAKCKGELIWYLLGRFEVIPELKLPAIKTEFDSVEEVFTEFARMEDTYCNSLETIAEKAYGISDMNAVAYALPIIKNMDHIACRALEAVKNKQCPLKLVKNNEEYLPW